MACSCCSSEHKGNGFFASTKWEITKLCITAVLLVLSYFWHNIVGDSIGMYFDPSWIAIILCGIPIMKSAWHGLVHHRKIQASLLITVAIVSSVALEIVAWCGISLESGHMEHYLFAAGEIAFLMGLGGFIENLTVKKTRKGIERLVDLSPRTAVVKLFGELLVMEVSQIQPGDIVVVKPNDMIPVDGVVVSGETAVDQASITGESVPCDKKEGDAVFAGTWNKSGAIEVKVTKRSDETTVAKLISLVEEAEGKKAPIARLADRWASFIVPSAIALAFIVCFATKFFADISWLEAAIRGVTILVVFCPCSLALATPTAIAAGLGALSYRGIMVKSGKAIEELAKVDTVCFDKTGTLTTGQIRVNEFFCDGIDEKEFLALAGGTENSSEHPIAKAVVDFAKEKGNIKEAQKVNSIVGLGVEAEIDGQKVLIARWQHFEKEKGVVAEKASAMLEKGLTVMGVSVDGKVVGCISVSDTIRQDSKQAVEAINENYDTVMLTGDNKNAALRMADLSGVKEVKYELLPDQKVESIREKQQGGKKVCMIGDGVNDAPSLATADCSIAMGAFGSDLAIETADIALMNNEVARLPGLMKFSKKILRTIKGNIILAMAINVIAIILSAVAVLDPVTGALVHNCTSLFVVGNSALLFTDKDKTFKNIKGIK